MSAPFNVRWGILATGGIAESFVRDLLLPPSTRSVSNITHTITAVASSSSLSRAQSFISSLSIPSSHSPTPYGSYSDLVADKNIDVIYIATPHSHHYQNCVLALNAGKNVLCEKAFTTNEAQTARLIELAKEKGLFLMEAVWTRYFPLSISIREFIQGGKLGSVYRVIADNSFGDDVAEKYGTKHRMVNMSLAGGALLDLGIYSLTWVFQCLYTTLPAEERKPPSEVKAIATIYPQTGSDESTSIILKFPKGPHSEAPAQGVALTSLRTASDVDGKGTSYPAIRIQGTKGEIQVFGPAFRPTRWRYIPGNAQGISSSDKSTEGDRGEHGVAEGDEGGGKGGVEDHDCPIPGHGMFWEADEVARALQEGRKEGGALGWEESRVIMGVMDEVRRQVGVKYPEAIETLEYPVELPGQ